MSTLAPSVSQHFVDKSENVQATYDRLLKAVARFGPFTEDPKKTSIHLNRRTAFAGVATRKQVLLLTIKAAKDIKSPRVRKREQASANRWHLELSLASPKEIDTELVAWLQDAYDLSA
jgi:hypothetical protein